MTHLSGAPQLAIFTIAPNRPFLDTLAAAHLARHHDTTEALADAIFLLPTKRAARALADAFLRQSGGRPLLLPRIIALGAPDEAGLALTAALDLPQAVPAALRTAILTQLILKLDGRNGAPTAPDQAWTLAVALAALLDEAALNEIDLARALPNATGGEFAEHWQNTLIFLDIITHAWPTWLQANGYLDVAARHVALLRAQGDAWAASPPAVPVIAAGITGAVPAALRLLAVIARMPAGQVVLPGFDLGMDAACRADLTDTHPQTALHDVLAGLGAESGDVAEYPPTEVAPVCASARIDLLRTALLPAAQLGQWQTASRDGGTGVYALHASDQQHEAVAIALALRNTLEMPGATAALVTPDRALAARVAAELQRFGVVADDSAGEALADSPPAVFLRLLAEAADLRPVSLLALLKHPLAALGLSPAAARNAARTLEIKTLRGPRPAAGFAGLAQNGAAPAFLARLKTAFAALHALPALAPAPEWFAALIQSAEAAATTDATSGPEILWRGEDGEALAAQLSELLPSLARLPSIDLADVAPLLTATLAGIAVRGTGARRAGGAAHPRVFIWGLLEARLQSADLLVLGGLTEGTWPAIADPGPWLNRDMRRRVGLPSPDAAIGAAALDFCQFACAAPEVVLSAPARRDGAPAVPARWLTRLNAFLGSDALPSHPSAAWANLLDKPYGDAVAARAPAPCPAVAHRPRRLSVTDIGTWLIDPYAIYARRILNLEKLKDIEEPADASDYGTLVHQALADFAKTYGTTVPFDHAAALRDVFLATLIAAQATSAVRPALAAWWRPRLMRIADWIADTAEPAWREGVPLAALIAEQSGEIDLAGPAGPFLLRARADRIDRRQSDHSLGIIDYKTGTVPSNKNVEAGLAPQLPLEAMMLARGAFGAAFAGDATRLAYWGITGGPTAGKKQLLFGGDAGKTRTAAALAETRLCELIAIYDDPARPYLAQPLAGQVPRFSDYAQLARVAEWTSAEDEAET